MRCPVESGSVLFAVLILSVLSAGPVPAQTAGGRPAARAGQKEAIAPEDMVRIRGLTGLEKRATTETPEYRTNVPRQPGDRREWVRIAVEYDTAPEWIDELTFRYYVLSLKEVDRKQEFSLFQNSVKYADIRQDRGHLSTMFLRPPAVERYGELSAIAVEIMYGGDVIAKHSITGGIKLPEDWWKNSDVVKSDKVKSRAGYLLDRKQSPFFLINIDSYEYIK
ncbi:MAG: hypothetical protein R6V03_02260 [Kiritimatiellia bacterium]